MELTYIIIGVVVVIGVGVLIGWLIGRGQSNATIKQEKESILQKLTEANRELITLEASSKSQLEAQVNRVAEREAQIETLKEKLETVVAQFDLNKQWLATANAKNTANEEKLERQKQEIEELGKKFNTEFENIANKILDTKTEKFTELNRANLKAILDPLGENISAFKKTVNDTYVKEAKERFSLGERVKELAQLNQVISEEARNLTKALKGEVKTQGRWGEMILENILEKSGLRKDEEYFLEYQLEDEQGKALRSGLENKKMRPDAVIKYPDNRTVIIDSKVSLNAYTRFIEATDVKEQKAHLEDHVTAIKNHILTLSAKGYDDYDKSLDFVMMFIPSEPAYTAALQGDSNLWNFAYDKRILLINPTNLIISLKLIVDLWKREYQNQNAQAIAERGARLYEKFVGFVSNLEEVGKHIDKAKEAYSDSYKQLSTGHGNLVTQATQLKNLGLVTKKELPKTLVENSGANSLLD